MGVNTAIFSDDYEPEGAADSGSPPPPSPPPEPVGDVGDVAAAAAAAADTGPAEPIIGKPVNFRKMFSRKGTYWGPISPTALWEYPDLSIYAKAIWIALADFGGMNGECYPSYEALAKRARISRSQVARALKELEVKGFARHQRGGKGSGSNRYELLWHGVFAAWRENGGKSWPSKGGG